MYNQKILNAIKYALMHDIGSARNYLVLGSFDGLLLSISIIMGSVFYNISTADMRTVIISGLVGTSISSLWNAFVVELSQKKEELEELERQLMRSLKGTVYDYSGKISAVVSGISHGVSPFLGLLPFEVFSYTHEITYTMLVSLILLFSMGLLYGNEIKQKIRTSVVMILAGVIAVAIIYVIS
ncbi:hypothetical protein [Sulfuracidifex tepidarius]|uniref:VIT family protein n=1 Tax=Sulfuracidifex tepidarius TaxID=1294262 RepID=A0A510DV07_9CREN|nr:hypothetical protein [Sulfuracidifex tepidarius]BBG24066.1 hypothetical protein IC006_1367 [Sulfuracidifex tepidarius]BBG26821.1 hypothetical protein IC007_1342 [Sulfuracidifex tepidarius]